VTIGGCVDAEVMAEAEDVLSASRPKLLSFDLGDEDAWEIGLTCGGTIEVFVEPVALGRHPASDGALALYEKVRAHVASGGSAAILTRMDADGGGAKLLVRDDGHREGSLGDPLLDQAAPAAARAALATGVSRTVGLGPGDAVQVFVEVHVPPATLLVVGGSHVAMPLIALAKTLGYRTVVVDGRPRFATRERFPDVDDLQVGIPSELVRRVPLGPTTALVLVAHDYKYDLPVLRYALTTEVGYIGMLGSRRRGDAILRMLREEGVAEAALGRIRVPIGLDLGAKTAPEIGLAILAEIVAARYGGTGRPLVVAKRAGEAAALAPARAATGPDPAA
jgi:xanthine dehydrogenase accessory factor